MVTPLLDYLLYPSRLYKPSNRCSSRTGKNTISKFKRKTEGNGLWTLTFKVKYAYHFDDKNKRKCPPSRSWNHSYDSATGFAKIVKVVIWLSALDNCF